MENSVSIKDCRVILEREPLSTPKTQVGLSAELRNVINARNILTTRTKKKILSDLDEINETNVEKERKVRRSQAVSEILSSEISYLNQLEIIKDYFMKPIKERNILTTDEFQTLFGNIRIIYNINSQLLCELQKNPENVAQAFSKIAPYFKLYSVYAYDYKKSLSILQKAPFNNLALSNFLELQESRPEVQTKLSALLITPIQRVPRYRLLLKQVLNHTSSTHPTYSSIIGSLKQVEEAAVHINNLLEEQENTQRLLELQRSLQNGYPSIIKPDRKLIKGGILMKMTPNGGHSNKCYFVLMSDILMCCKLKKENPNIPNSLKCSCILPLNKCKITENLSKGAFTITCENEMLVLHHEHLYECEEWILALKEAVKKYVNNRRTLRKDSSSRRPVHKKNIREYQDLGISPGKPRRKKQLLEDEAFPRVFKNTASDSEDSDCKANTCFVLKATKRKAIRNYDHELSVPLKAQKHADEVQDSLYPLRQRLFKIEETKSSDEVIMDNQLKEQEQYDKTSKSGAVNGTEVFVFGKENQPRRGFNFNMFNVLTNVGNSFRRLFGFKSN